MALHDINPDRVPTPPYTDLQAALAAFDELVDNVAGIIPVAIDDVAHRYGVAIAPHLLPFSTDDDTDRMGGHLDDRNQARRMLGRAIVERLLGDDDLVLYPVPNGSDVDRVDIRAWGGAPIARTVAAADEPLEATEPVDPRQHPSPAMLDHLLDELNARLKEGGINVGVSATYLDGRLVEVAYHHPARRIADRPQA